jgi:hypothetical protein
MAATILCSCFFVAGNGCNNSWNNRDVLIFRNSSLVPSHDHALLEQSNFLLGTNGFNGWNK